ncbi:MAG: 5-aminolevulinate synthase [Oligoflexia bacterium]|nr:5-aminolevulinate synthase [Oligoflexia bacterium]
MSEFNYDSHFGKLLLTLKREGRYRVFIELLRKAGSFPEADQFLQSERAPMTVWCSNDYLGMGQNPVVLKAMHETLEEHGAGAGGTRNISGNHHLVCALEHELADLHHKDAALVFSSGYVANETALSTLGRVLPNCIIYSDSHNHASMIEGIRHSGAEKHIFQHSDPDDLEKKLRAAPAEQPKIVAFESVYSMGGDIAPMLELANVARKYGALTYLDETHAVGLYGPRGGGLAEREDLLNFFDVIQGGLGKGFGVVGGFVTGGADLIDVIRSYGNGFIFTTSMPPVVAAGALASVRYLKTHSAERTNLFRTVGMVREMLDQAGIPLLKTESHILPVMVGDSRLCKQAADLLLEKHRIYIQPINYPTVPRGTERLRVTPSPLHTAAMADQLVSALQEVFDQLEVEFTDTVGEIKESAQA